MSQFDKLIVELKKTYDLDVALRMAMDKKKKYDELAAKANELGLDTKKINNMFWQDFLSSFDAHAHELKKIFQAISDDDTCEQEKKKPGTKRKSITEPKSDAEA
jgi:L-rhamnose isomerase